MSNHITTELVEKIARARVNKHAEHFNSMPETDRALKTWEEQDKLTQHGVRETVLNQLNELTPHLIAAGWNPPSETSMDDAS